MALGPAIFGGEPSDPPGVHQGGVAGRDLLGEDDGAAAQPRIGDIGFLQEVANEPRADHPDVVDARRQIRIGHRREGLGDLLDLELDRALGVDAAAGDALVNAAHEARIGQHREMGIEDIADLVGSRSGERGGARLQLAQLLHRNRDGFAKAGALGFDRGFGDPALADRQLAAIADIGGPDRDPRRYADPRQPQLAPSFACAFGPGGLVNPHRTCIRSGGRASRLPSPRRARSR